MMNSFLHLLQIGVVEDDHSELKLQKQFLVFLAIFMSFGGIVWGTISFAYELYAQGGIPYGYMIISIFNLRYFYRSKNFHVVKNIQTTISLLLPFFFQWSLGGFAPSGAIMFWATLALLASITFQKAFTSYFWLACFLVLTLFSGIFDSYFFELKPEILPAYSLPFLVINMTIIPTIVFGLMLYIVKKQENTQRSLETHQEKILIQNKLLQTNEEQLLQKNEELNRYGENLEKKVEERTQNLQESEAKLKKNLTIVEKQRDEIVSSINYALRIQNAIIPKEIELQKHFDCFVLYRPKDIVSGDFYWFMKKGNTKILAVADCTGHGVSGALMTMITNNILNQLVNDYSLYSPDEILNKIPVFLEKTLLHSEGSIKDGMDIIIVSIEQNPTSQNNTERPIRIDYAGSRTPLYCAHKGEIHKLKVDSFTITPNKIENYCYNLFNLPIHKIKNEETLTLYLCTDGFQDQFGGENDTKFLTKRFANLLLEVSTETMKDQKVLLDDALDAWKGKRKQTDDVLVVGLRM